jgi:para-aminobenzoate synthetase / 4-amino-4-deoxychorismate lyase
MRPDPALGVFDTMLAREGRVHALGAHLERLEASAMTLYGLSLPDGVAATVAKRAAQEHSEPRRLRVDAVPVNGELRVSTSTTAVAPGVWDPVALEPLRVPGGLGAHKWIDRRLLHAHPNALLLDGDEMLEGAWGNLWLLEGERVITPPTDGRILPGVTRALLLENAPALGLEPRAEPLPLARVLGADALFLTSAVRHVVAAGLHATPSEHPRLRAIREALAAVEWPPC